MIHAFRLGPVALSPAPTYTYAAALPSGRLELCDAATDAAGLETLKAALGEHPLCAEEALEQAATRLGIEAGPLPSAVMEARAQLAYELASGIHHGTSRPDAINAFLVAAAAFWKAKAWELIASDEQLHVVFSVGRAVVEGELSVQAPERDLPRVVLCDEDGPLARLQKLEGAARVAEIGRAGGLFVELVKEPAWAVGAIQAHFKLPRIPMPERRRGGRATSTATQDLVLAAALLQGIVAFADLGAEGEAEAVVEAAGLRVKVRLGPTPHDVAGFEAAEGLTRVGQGKPAPVPAEPPAEPPAAAGEEDDAPLSPAELAALLKGGAAEPSLTPRAAEAAAAPPEPAAPVVPPPAADEPGAEADPALWEAPAAEPTKAPGAEEAGEAEDDAPLSPAELAALLKGGGAPEAPAKAEPAAEAAPAAAAAAEEDDAPLSPAELAALMKGGSGAAEPATAESEAPPAAAPDEPPAAPAPAPVPVEPPAATPIAQVALTPARPVEPPAAPPTPAPPAPPDAQAAADQPGWLQKAWRALAGGKGRAPPAAPAPKAEAKPAAKPAAKAPPKPAAKPVARPAPKPPPPPPPHPKGPFGPFADALKVEVPAEPPAISLAEHAEEEALSGRLAAAAAGRERFVSFPAVALQIIEQVNAPDADARGVAGFISRDPGLAADVLAVANSAALRGVSEVTSVRDAVARLGLQEVGRVASAVSARALLVPAQAGGAPSTALFTRAVAVATAASAAALRLPGAHSDQVWLAGLLHDVGFALGASALPALVAEGAGVPAPLAGRALERAHVEIGAKALQAWGLPKYLAEVCAHHHDEACPAGPEHVDLHLVRLTSALARLDEPLAASRAAREVVQSARALGFDAHAVRALAADLKAAAQRAAVLVR